MNLNLLENGAQRPATTHAAFTVQGGKRRANGDRYLVSGRLAMVADGISSSSIGAESAASCVERMEALWPEASGDISPKSVRALLEQVNGYLLSRAMMLPSRERRRGGCCIAGVMLSEDAQSATVFHAGDASVHVMSRSGLRALTTAHACEKGNPRRSSGIRSALGVIPDPLIEIDMVELLPGEQILLATDGCDLEAAIHAPETTAGGAPEVIAELLRQANAAPTDDATAVILAPFPAG